MLQLVSKKLSPIANQKLLKLQKEVNVETSFQLKVAKAKTLWKNRTNNKVFDEIKSKLKELCIPIEICAYCEHSEATDIEHVYPKSFFPESTFEWENYLLACKICNSHYKLDQCHVVDRNGICRKIERGQEPIYKEMAFVHPRKENPNDYMLIDICTGKYIQNPSCKEKIQFNKVEKTLEILELNDRTVLIEARKQKEKYIFLILDMLVKIINAKSNQELSALLTPYDMLDLKKSLDENKQILKENVQKDIQKQPHPSVWYSIQKIESKTNPKWKQIFRQLPEALDW